MGSCCALAEEAKTPSAATATISTSMTISNSMSAIEYCLVVVVILLSTAPLLLTDALTRHIQYYRAQGAAHPPQGTIFAVTWTLLDVANFRERRKAEVQLRRIILPRTWVNRARTRGQSFWRTPARSGCD